MDISSSSASLRPLRLDLIRTLASPISSSSDTSSSSDSENENIDSSSSSISSSNNDNDGVFFFLIGGNKAQRRHVKHLLSHAHLIASQLDPTMMVATESQIYHQTCAAAIAISELVCHVSDCGKSKFEDLDETIMRKLYRYETRYGCAALAIIVHLHSWRVSPATRAQVKALQSTSLPLMTVIVDIPLVERDFRMLSMNLAPSAPIASSSSATTTALPRVSSCQPSRWLDERFVKHYSPTSAPYTNRDILVQMGDVKSRIVVLPPSSPFDKAIISDRDDAIVLEDGDDNDNVNVDRENGGDDGDDEPVTLDTHDIQYQRHSSAELDIDLERERIVCLHQFYNGILTLFE